MIIGKVIKKYGHNQKDIAKKLGLSITGFRNRFNNPTINTIRETANAIGCEPHELIETSEQYAHFYDKGEWLGIRKK